ncbi:hypothetical protein ACIPY3_02400 [Paenarthrobacter sp. NPDC089714]|uniref:hypothetical protein n=1 Tax=Paenarthrobacter sp. NPDC089714 TaxID=3364377 RepID=UPI0038184379
MRNIQTVSREQMKARLEAAVPDQTWYSPEEVRDMLEHAGADADCIGQDSTFISGAPQDMVKLHNALDAVEALHKPVDSGHPNILGKVCDQCSDLVDLFTFYPCATVEAIQAALGGEA